MVRKPQDERARLGTAEIESKTKIDDLIFRPTYDVVPANADIGAGLEIGEGTRVLRRAWELVDPATGRREAWSVSHIPETHVRDNLALCDPANEPWPRPPEVAPLHWC